jgi:two-component system chemotaxis sensor kinase CheA
LLWEWFQDPPSSEAFSQQIDEVLEEVHQVLTSEEFAGEANDADLESTSDKNASDEKTVDPSSLNQVQEEPNEGTKLDLDLDVDFGILEDFLMEAEDELQTLENLMIEVEDDPSAERLNRLYRAMHTLKGGFGFCNLDICSEVTHAAEDLLDDLRENPPDAINKNWMELLLSSVDFIRSMLSELQTVLENEKERLSTDLSKTYVDRLKEDLARAADGKKQDDDFEILTMDDGTENGDDQSIDNDQVKVDLETIDEVVDLVGELVISKSELDQKLNGSQDRETDQVLSKQQKIMNKLQRKSMNMRMLPIKREFRKFPRVVRDLSGDLDKQVDLIIEGETTEIDKSILDGLEGPLMHLVRNAIDHGIESPEKRKQKGKPPEAQLRISAYHESGQVYVEVEDDGRGLPTAQIEEKAIEQNLIEEDHDLSKDQIHAQILKPGFSTADEVTDVSGRGVGLDVVATEIESLQGNVLIESEADEGTKFILELPLTVAIIDGLIARIDDEKFIFPVSQVEESINPDPEDVQVMQDEGRVVSFRDHLVPVIDPGHLLENSTEHQSVETRTIFVIVSNKEERFAVWIDELLAHEQIVIKQIDSHEVEDLDLTSGAAILGDGSVGLIIDVIGLVRNFQKHGQR